jgi:hypothetical protein
MKPIAWYDPSNGMVSTDQDCPLFTPLGQVWGLYLKEEAKDEPVKIAHKHEWFRTGEMKVGQMRCISCGTWGQEEMPQRPWVGLTLEEILETYRGPDGSDYVDYARGIEAKLKEKNT